MVVANRLPVRGVERNGQWEWSLSSGGLVSALVPVLGDSEGVWIGWAGISGGEDEVPPRHEGIALRAVPISEEEYEGFYLGFANATLWPLYHDAIRPPTFDRALVARLRHGQRALCGGGGRGRGTGSHGLDPRLSAPARPVDAAEAPTRRADRVLPAHPVPAPRAVPAASVAAGDPRRAPRRRPGGVPGTGRGIELRPPRPPRRRRHGNGRGGALRGPPDTRRRVSDLGRCRRARWSRRAIPPCRRGRASSAPSSAIRSSCCSESIVSTTRRASIGACERSVSSSPTARSTRRVTWWCRSRCRAARKTRTTNANARTWNASSARSTVSTRASAVRPSTTCTRAWSPTSSWRCTARPTSCS